MTDVLILLDSLETGGAEKQALLLAGHLVSEKGYHVTVWTCSMSGNLDQRFHHIGISVDEVNFSFSLSSRQIPGKAISLICKVRKLRPRVILSFSIHGNTSFGLIWRFTGARLFIWGQRNAGRNLYQRRVSKWAARLTPVFVSNSEHGCEFLTNKLSVPGSKISLIKNGVIFQQARDSVKTWREKLELGHDVRVGVMLANFSPSKDQSALIRLWKQVWEQLSQRNVKSKLILAGRFDGGVMGAKAIAWDLEMTRDQIVFLEEIEDVGGFLEMADVGFFFSKSEGMPNSVLEYMMHGLPVIVNDLPGLRQILFEENQNIILSQNIEQKDINEIVELMMNEIKLKKIGELNRKLCEGSFSAQDYFRAFDKVISIGLK